MSHPTVAPTKTDAARQLLAGPRGSLSPALRMLLINVDGRRGEAELLDIARSLGLDAQALRTLQRDGLITGAALRPAVEPAPARPVPASPPAPAPGPSAASTDDLRRLMKAKMFALDLAGRMLAGRDAELRASARAVDSEARFLDWLADASARIEAASDAERAQMFRDRVAAAVA